MSNASSGKLQHPGSSSPPEPEVWTAEKYAMMVSHGFPPGPDVHVSGSDTAPPATEVQHNEALALQDMFASAALSSASPPQQRVYYTGDHTPPADVHPLAGLFTHSEFFF